MRSVLPVIVAAAFAASATMGGGQERAANTRPTTDQKQAASVSSGQAAIDRAAAANKYVFLFFWTEREKLTDNAWSVFQPAATRLAEWSVVISIQITDSAEQKLVKKYGADRAPLPLVLAIAPCGAITKAFTKTFDESQLRTAFVSPCTQRCLKALQSRKLVFVCVVEKTDPIAPLKVPKGVED
jgi:hypothetical protein